MNEQDTIKRIQAFLHDPPEKPIILGRIGHEGRAKEIMRLLNLGEEAEIPHDIRDADHIASAADRINLPRNEKFAADFLKNPIIKHPLSAREFDLNTLDVIDHNEIIKDVNNAIIEIYDRYGGDKEKIKLSLWRELLEILKRSKDGKKGIGLLWELLPAETRIPEHTIWDHKRITAAVAGSLPRPAFLLFAIGPVQEFIAMARKTQDLWAGSYMLSYLSWMSMKVIAERIGPESIIFPDLCGQPFVDLWLANEKGIGIVKPGKEYLASPTLPNRFFAIVPEDDARELAVLAEEKIRSVFSEICNAVKMGIEKKIGISSESWSNIWQRQTKEFIETYWIYTPVSDYKDFLGKYKDLVGIKDTWDFDDLIHEYEKTGYGPNIGTVYGQIYRFTEKAMGSRKTVRAFSYGEEPNFKCTLCGVREPLHPGEYNKNSCSEKFGALQGFWQGEMVPKLTAIRSSERLCAICASKRFAANFYFKDNLNFDINPIFPSLSMVATAAFKKKVILNLDKPELITHVHNFIETIEELFKGNEERLFGNSLPMIRRMCNNEELQEKELAYKFAKIEGEWLYEDSSLKDVLCNYKEELWSASRDHLRKLIKSTERLGINGPSKYYSVLLMDGDNMGKWLSGEMAPTVGEVLHPVVKNILDSDPKWRDLLGMSRPLTPSLHLAISKALRDFSLKVVREVVERDHLGKLVYAGGDDVLAFVSLPDLPDVMRKLRATFSGHLLGNKDTNKVEINFENGRGFIPVDHEGHPINPESSGKKIEGFLISMGEKATASMGVVIAHHNSNLLKVLELVRNNEKKAKKIEDKNAWCIALAKRSGGTETFEAKWFHKRDGKGIFESIMLLKDWIDAFSEGRISPRFVYHFRKETKGIVGLPNEAIMLEIMRITSRHSNIKKLKEEEIRHLVEGLIFIAEDSSLEDIAKFLSIAAFLGREVNR